MFLEQPSVAETAHKVPGEGCEMTANDTNGKAAAHTHVHALDQTSEKGQNKQETPTDVWPN